MESMIYREQFKFLSLLIEQEPYLLKLNLQELTIGSHNSYRLLNRCLQHSAYKSMEIILELCDKKLISVDYFSLLRCSLTEHPTPEKIITRLFKMMHLISE